MLEEENFCQGFHLRKRFLTHPNINFGTLRTIEPLSLENTSKTNNKDTLYMYIVLKDRKRTFQGIYISILKVFCEEDDNTKLLNVMAYYWIS